MTIFPGWADDGEPRQLRKWTNARGFRVRTYGACGKMKGSQSIDKKGVRLVQMPRQPLGPSLADSGAARQTKSADHSFAAAS